MSFIHSYSTLSLPRKPLLCFLILCAGLICSSHVLAQGDNTPTGVAGSFGGSISTGGGSFDPLERNAVRSVTDLVVPGAVIPFTYTRTWNSRSYWRHNWQWFIEDNEATELGGGADPNDMFIGYIVSYPDGRVVKFNKPSTPPHAPLGTPGTYTSPVGVLDRFVIDSDLVHSHLYMSDGSVLNFDNGGGVTSLVDPHGRAVTFQYDTAAPWGTKVIEPGGRWIYFVDNQFVGNTNRTTVTTSLNTTQIPSLWIDYTTNTSGSYPDPWHAGSDTGMYSASILTTLGAVTYNEIPDPGSPSGKLEAHYTYKNVQPLNPNRHPGDPPTYAFNRLVWACDPMFQGPLQQIKYLYVDNCTGSAWSNGDNTRTCVREEHWATGADDPGVMISRAEMPANAPNGSSEGAYTRVETHGDGTTRTLSYYNPTVARGQVLADHFTDFTNNLSQTERHEYDLTHLFHTPTKITDMRQNVTNQTLESILGNITKETHPDTNYVSWTYTDSTEPYYVATTKDELLSTATYTRDPVTHFVTRIDYPGGTSETFTYDPTYSHFNQVTDHQLANSTWEHFRYDARGLKTSEWNDAYPTEKTYFFYDTWDRLDHVQDPHAVALGIPYSVMYKYNGRHQIIETHYPSTGHSPDPTVFNQYDKWGHCTSTIDELGNTKTKIYDDYGRVTSLTETLNAPNWNGTSTVANRTTEWTYERVRNGTTYAANTHVAKEWRTQTEPAYDKDGNRRRTVREYDVNNRLVTEQTGWIVSAAGAATFGPPDGETHSYEYDANGNKTKYTDPLSRVTTYAYDSRNRLTTTTEPLNRVTAVAYDAVSNKTLVTFPDSKTQQWLDYDAFGQPGRFIDERNDTTNLTYQSGPMKKLATVTTHRDKDSSGVEDQLTTFTYDGAGHLTTTLFPDHLSTEVTMYQYGLVTSWKTRKNATKIFNPLSGYDARERELLHTWSDGTPGITRTWDDASRLTSILNSNSRIDYTYDGAGQVGTESNTVTGASGTTVLTTYRYPDGNPATLIYPNGFRLRRDYTARGQLASTGSGDSSSNWLTQFATYNYLSDGKVTSESYGNLASTTFHYDPRGFIDGTNTSKLSQVYSNRTYYRDTRDRITAWVKSNTPLNNPLENGRGDAYGYDPEGQLTGASYQALTPNTTPTGAQRTDSFVYDQLGNRKSPPNNQIASLGSVTIHRRDNGLNQYLDWTQSAINYESNGNLYQDGWLTASFNALNQTTGIWSSRVTPSGDAVNSAYDPLGRCVTRLSGVTNPVTTYLYYDGWNLIQEGPNATTANRLYAHGNRVDEIVASQAGGQWAYHHYDARGHCILLTDSTGNLIEQYDYDAFGKPYFYNATGVVQASSGWGNRFLFTGREWLKEVAVYDFRNRYYHPELGRFIQPDPKEFEAGDYNLYRYCHNDPVNRSDPYGMYEMVGDGWTHESRTQFNQAQQAAAARLAAAASAIEGALKSGGKQLESVTKSFEKKFGPGTATTDKMTKVSQNMHAMVTALRDDGTQGYLAHVAHNPPSPGVLAKGVQNGKNIYVYTDSREYGHISSLTWAVGHESGHNVGLEHPPVNGITAYKYGATDAQRNAYRSLPVVNPEAALRNPDVYMDFAQ